MLNDIGNTRRLIRFRVTKSSKMKIVAKHKTYMILRIICKRPRNLSNQLFADKLLKPGFERRAMVAAALRIDKNDNGGFKCGTGLVPTMAIHVIRELLLCNDLHHCISQIFRNQQFLLQFLSPQPWRESWRDSSISLFSLFFRCHCFQFLFLVSVVSNSIAGGKFGACVGSNSERTEDSNFSKGKSRLSRAFLFPCFWF